MQAIHKRIFKKKGFSKKIQRNDVTVLLCVKFGLGKRVWTCEKNWNTDIP